MGSLFRSEDMNLCHLYIQPEAAYQILSDLGEQGTAQFRDLNAEVNSFEKRFVTEVRRCDEIERKLRFIDAEMKKEDVKLPPLTDIPLAPQPKALTEIEAYVEKIESDIREHIQNTNSIRNNYVEVQEFRHVLERTALFFAEQEEEDAVTKALMTEDFNNQGRGRLMFLAGVVPREKFASFEKMMWRISRGNILMRRADIDEPIKDPTTGHEVFKTVFVAFYQGERLKTLMQKVCSGFHANVYPCSESIAERNDALLQVKMRLEDIKTVLNESDEHRQRVLLSAAKEIQQWAIMVKKMKAIYCTLDMLNMDVTQKCMIGECWIPVQDIKRVQQALNEASKNCGSTIPSFLNVVETKAIPPTFYRTNRFTQGFQNLIEAYGVASYLEANPALYTIITFPFLFAVMFGDCGHGLILVLFALTLVIKEKKFLAEKSDNEIWNIFFGGRYIILLMGIFSIYTGFMYNDLFSKSMNIFGSSWGMDQSRYDFVTSENKEEIEFFLNPTYDYEQTPYWFGLDPVWMLAKNKIIFQNSLKMKLSIILGVVHMIFGICMGLVNFIRFRKYANILLDFLPQILFFGCLFLYMVSMMIIKWFLYNTKNDLNRNERCAPSILILFINMMLFKENEVEGECDKFMFDFQGTLQDVLKAIAFISVPVLLFGKPIHFLVKRKWFPAAEEEEAEPFGEIMIHQAIHTIEFVLNSISHTASYLRLWALSLAHSQLSEVVWSRVFKIALSFQGYVGAAAIFVIFAFWAAITVAILVIIEGLSAFLHTLRLHWVEFMSKFYEGVGYAFEPFCFKKILEAEEEGAA